MNRQIDIDDIVAIRFSQRMKNLFYIFTVVCALTWTPFANAAKITAEVCEADYTAMIDEAERNRESSLAELNAALRLTNDEDAAGSINHQINQTWEMEEAFRKHAATAYRDCMNYVKSSGS